MRTISWLIIVGSAIISRAFKTGRDSKTAVVSALFFIRIRTFANFIVSAHRTGRDRDILTRAEVHINA